MEVMLLAPFTGEHRRLLPEFRLSARRTAGATPLRCWVRWRGCSTRTNSTSRRFNGGCAAPTVLTSRWRHTRRADPALPPPLRAVGAAHSLEERGFGTSSRHTNGSIRLDIHGKTIIVTGGGGGIGSATAVLLAEHGANVALVDRDEAACREVRSGLAAGSHLVVGADVTDPDDAAGLFRHLNAERREFGGLVNAAGIVTGGLPWPASDLDRMRTVIEVNAAATAVWSTLAARQEGGERAIVNVASGAAIRAHPPDPAYAASKAGVLAFTRSAAAAALPGVRVNAVLPGVVRTPMLETTGTNGVAPWLRPRLSQPLLSAAHVAEAIVELIRGDYQGEAWSLELDKSRPDLVVRTSL